MTLIFLLIFLIPFGLGATLILRGIRGYRIGDHPVCRRCGFDLFGQPAGTFVCGECGTSLTKPGSVVIGHRQRRPTFTIAGLIILVPVLFVAGVMVWGQISAINWLSYAPTRFVIWRAASPNPSARSPAISVLDARLTANKLSVPELERIADAALAYQADLGKPWDAAWGEVLEKMRASGELSDDRWKRYLQQASAGLFGWRLPNTICRGDPLVWLIDVHPLRAGTGHALRLRIQFEGSGVEWLSLHGPVRKDHGQFGITSSFDSPGFSNASTVRAVDFPNPIPDGLQRVHIHGTVNVGFPDANGYLTPVVTQKIDLPGTFKLLPATQPSE